MALAIIVATVGKLSLHGEDVFLLALVTVDVGTSVLTVAWYASCMTWCAGDSWGWGPRLMIKIT